MVPMLLWFFTLQDAKGLVDFRNVALALAALDGGRSLEELIRLAFEVPLRGCGDNCHPLPHSSSQEGGILCCSHWLLDNHGQCPGVPHYLKLPILRYLLLRPSRTEGRS